MMPSLILPDALWEKLIQPLSDTNPCGAYLVYESLYDEIQQARLEEDPTLPQGIWKRDLKKADWNKVIDLCLNALSHTTKDLQIAAWLMEGWTIVHGASGIKYGLKVIEAYCNTFWDTVHPQLKEEDVEFRMAPFHWINGKFADRLSSIPLAFSAETASFYTLLDWQQANLNAARPANQPRSSQTAANLGGERGRVTLDDFHKASAETPVDYYNTLWDDLQASLELSTAIDVFLSQKEPDSSGYLKHLKDQLQTLLTWVGVILKEKKPVAALEKLPSSVGIPLPLQGRERGKKDFKAPTSRAQAYEQLAEIADFLAEIEPHSPCPYLIRRAIRWSNMSMVELMQEIVRDQSDYHHILQLLGVAAKAG